MILRFSRQPLFCALLGSVFSYGAFGACTNVTPCDGSSDNECTLGGESKAKFEICLSVGEIFRIWGLENVDFGSVVPGEGVAPSQEMNFCAFSNQDDQSFNLALTSGDGMTGDLQLRDDAGETIDYQIQIETNGGTSELFTAYNQNFNFGPASGGSQPDPDMPCTNSNIKATVNVDEDSLKDASVGNYNDILVLTVSATS